MNITVNRSSLRSALTHAAGIANRKSTMPILGNALLRADGKSLSIAATNLRIAFAGEIDCDIKTAGALALDAQSLLDIVSSLSSDELTLRSTESGGGEIRAGKSRFQLAGAPTQDFPRTMDVSALTFCPVDAKSLAMMIGAVEFACLPINTDGPLSGILVDLRDGALVMAANRGGGAMIRGKVGGRLERVALAPRAALGIVLKSIGDVTEVELAITSSELYARVGKTLFGVKLIEAEFPADTITFFRAKSEHEMTVGREALIAAVERVSLVSSKEENHETRISLAKGFASLASKGAGKGMSEDEIAVAYEGAGVERMFNAAKVAEALKAMHGAEVVVGFDDNKFAPIQIQPLGVDGYKHAVLLMGINH